MISWLISVYDKCRDLAAKARDALMALEKGDVEGARRIQEYMRGDYKALLAVWDQVDPKRESAGRLSDLARHLRFGQSQDYKEILDVDLPDVQVKAEKLAKAGSADGRPVGFRELIHPVIDAKCMPLYKDGHLREAVLNGVIAVFDLIRSRTGSSLDGAALAGQAFGLENGKLIFSEVDTETGQNDQKGFLQIFQGVYTGVRNVKAHSLNHDLNKVKAAQYLVMLSLLARRVEECKDRV